MPSTEELGSVSSLRVGLQACSDQRPIHRWISVTSGSCFTETEVSDPNHGPEVRATVRRREPPATGRRLSGSLASASSPDQAGPKRNALLVISPPRYFSRTREQLSLDAQRVVHEPGRRVEEQRPATVDVVWRPPRVALRREAHPGAVHLGGEGSRRVRAVEIVRNSFRVEVVEREGDSEAPNCSGPRPRYGIPSVSSILAEVSTELRDRARSRIPYDFRIDIEVPVHDEVAHADHTTPRNV